jgi:hypothetical protein
MMGLEEYFSEEPQVYHIEGPAFTTGKQDDPGSTVEVVMPVS